MRIFLILILQKIYYYYYKKLCFTYKLMFKKRICKILDGIREQWRILTYAEE